jgi:thiamine-monophosphate kinase
VRDERAPGDRHLADPTGASDAGVSHLALGPGAEFDLVRALAGRWGSVARGLGDDCAVLDVPAGERVVVSTDTTVEGVHFRPAWLTPREIGYRAAMGAWSDLAAAAATPIGALLALSIPQQWVASMPDLADGIGEAGRLVGAPVVGGDTTAGTTLVITMTVLGTAAHPLTRAGAQPGDRVYVTGTLGGPWAAIRAWERSETPDGSSRARFARPEARLREARWLAARGISAAIDISDGLVGDLGHIAAASSVRVVIDLDCVPRWPGVAAVDAGASGEEYELALTSPVAIDSVAFAREFALPLTQIGNVVAGPPTVDVLVDGHRVDPIPGYDHLSR